MSLIYEKITLVPEGETRELELNIFTHNSKCDLAVVIPDGTRFTIELTIDDAVSFFKEAVRVCEHYKK